MGKDDAEKAARSWIHTALESQALKLIGPSTSSNAVRAGSDAEYLTALYKGLVAKLQES